MKSVSLVVASLGVQLATDFSSAIKQLQLLAVVTQQLKKLHS